MNYYLVTGQLLQNDSIGLEFWTQAPNPYEARIKAMEHCSMKTFLKLKPMETWVVTDYTEAMEGTKNNISKGKWIKVTEQLPHKNTTLHTWVLAINMNEELPLPFVVGYTYNGTPDFERLLVTHWMAIPSWQYLS